MKTNFRCVLLLGEIYIFGTLSAYLNKEKLFLVSSANSGNQFSPRTAGRMEKMYLRNS
jgi:hypothetical protein